MKKIFNTMIALILAIVSTSCLTSGLEELEVYSGTEITGVAGVLHRYYGTDVIPGSNEVQVKSFVLRVQNVQKDATAGTLTFDVTIPSNLPATEQGKVTNKALVVIVNLSSAAVVTPIGDAPKFGVPGDWSKPNQYKVRAANGNEQTWTLTATLK